VNGFDPQAPFIASDGWEYASVADKLLDAPPCDSYYNQQLARYIELEKRAAVEDFRKNYLRFRASSAYNDDHARGRGRGPGGALNFSYAASDYFNWLLADAAAAKGVRSALAGEAPADSVHAADQPPVPRRVGAQ
jgi:hypothetical protein